MSQTTIITLFGAAISASTMIAGLIMLEYLNNRMLYRKTGREVYQRHATRWLGWLYLFYAFLAAAAFFTNYNAPEIADFLATL